MGDKESLNDDNKRRDESRDDINNDDYLTEMSADFAVVNPSYERKRVDVDGVNYEEGEKAESSGYGLAWIAFFFAAASWFLWPVLMGATSAIIGVIAYTQGARGLAGAAIAIGAAAVLFRLLF